jgi:glycosyltransferase involved in cell wall biosynthesis
VHPEKTGFLMHNYGNPLSLAQQIETILNTPGKMRAVAMAGQAYAQENHDWSLVAAKLSEIYDKILCTHAQ